MNEFFFQIVFQKLSNVLLFEKANYISFIIRNNMGNNLENTGIMLFYFWLSLENRQEHYETSQVLWKLCRNHSIRSSTGTSSSPGLSSPSVCFCLSVLSFVLQAVSLHMVGKMTIIRHSQFSNFLRKASVSSPVSSRQSSILIRAPGFHTISCVQKKWADSCWSTLSQYLYPETRELGARFIIRNRRMREDVSGGQEDNRHCITLCTVIGWM